MTQRKLTRADILIALRQSLLDARENTDQVAISKLLTTFGVLVETSYQYEKPTMTGLFVSFEDAARNTMIGVGWKANIPTQEDVESVLE